MKIVIAGGTGLIGSMAVQRLTDDGHEVVILTRRIIFPKGNDKIRYALWDAKTTGEWALHLRNTDAVINLSGESIAGKRWTKIQKEKIIESRITPISALLIAIEHSSPRPRLLINASAVGYYGDAGKSEVDENSPKGKGFLADTCALWESEATKATGFGVRVVTMRMGIVLSNNGGALPRLIFPFKLWAGGHLGKGTQWMPWIHIEDLGNVIGFILTNSDLHGPVNVVSPSPVTMKEFSKEVGKAIGRPSWMHVPSFLLKLSLGEMSEMLLTGQKAIPRKLMDTGFRYEYNQLGEALTDLLKR